LPSTDLSAVKRDPNLRGRKITADYVADGLRDAIQSGRLADGAVLNQAAIAEHFGVSRVPVREAMRQLLAEGLIESEAHHIAVVRGIPLDRIRQLYDYRALLEGYITQRAVPLFTPALIKELRAKEKAMRKVPDHTKWLRLNTEFHNAILAVAGDETGLELVGQLKSRVERYVRMWSEGEGIHRPVEAGKEHARILDCIAAGGGEGARLAVEEPIRHTGERLVAYGESIRRTADVGSAA
jgi:DNA-binding GntR family transcriptional regulator